MPMKGLILLSFPLEIKREQNKFATMTPRRTDAGSIKKSRSVLLNGIVFFKHKRLLCFWLFAGCCCISGIVIKLCL